MTFPEVVDARVKINYTNYRGETRDRVIIPKDIYLRSSEWHKETQWILVATDCEKDELREFAMKDIHKWEPQVS